MKTIATAAVLMILIAPTWALEPEHNQANDPATNNEPIVLSDAELDEVTAGTGYLKLDGINGGSRGTQGSVSIDGADFLKWKR